MRSVNAASAFGRIVAGYAGDRIGALRTYLLSCLGTGTMLLALFGTTHTGSLIVFCALYGIFSGGVIALNASSIVSILPDLSDVAYVGSASTPFHHSCFCRTRMGAAFCIIALGTLVGPPINGALLGDNFTWWKAIVVSAVRPH